MTATILLIGKNGQIGRELSKILPGIGKVVALGRDDLDLSKPDHIRNSIRSLRPHLIVNAAAYTAVDKAESEEPLATAINGRAPGIMAEEAKKIGAALVHYSTDYVFDGLKTSPYMEDDQPNPQSVYGRTKLEGERAIQHCGVPHLIFRTAWVYAREGRNFLLTILRLATQREELRIVSDQIGAPTWSEEIARATMRILAKSLARESGDPAVLSSVSGIYHMTAQGQTSWFQFAEMILEEARNESQRAEWIKKTTAELPLITKRVIPILSAEYPTPARRPAYSVLSNARLANTFNMKLPDWQEQLHSIFAKTADANLS
jgi:dTDP-4-dehydrorhamnose reductase